MKIRHIPILTILTIFLVLSSIGMALSGCTTSMKVANKSGAQLWAENCQRCHNTPSPSSFTHEQWETIGLHMQSRALITDTEREKIVEFLKQ